MTSTALGDTARAAAPRTATLTQMQQRLLLQHRLHPGDGSFNLAYAFAVDRDVDVERLRETVALVTRHALALNTTFEDRCEGPVAVLNAEGVEPAVHVLQGHDDPETEADAVTGWLSERADRPIAPDRWPLYEIALHVGRHGVYMTMLASHLVGDAYTFYNLMTLVERLYEDPRRWPAFLDQLASHPAAVVPARAGSEAAVAAFRDLLDGVSGLEHEALAAVRPGGGALTGVQHSVKLPPELAEQLRGSDLVASAGPFPVFLAAYAVVLGALTGRRDVVVGVPVANRRGAAQREALGYFVNTLPLPIDLSRHDTFAALVAHVSARAFTLLRHQDIDLVAHADEILPGHRGPLAVDNAFTYYKRPLAPQLAGRQVRPLPVPRRHPKYPLGMSVEDRGDGYLVTVEHLDRLAAADPAACLEHVLRCVAATPDVPLRELGVVSAERARELDRLTGISRHYPTPPSLDDWFRATAARRGAATAVVDAEGQTSYAELDGLVDRVANAVAALTAGHAVGIAMDRRRDLVAVILGVLRAGRTYVPIDPGAPAERVRHIVGQFDDLLLVADDGVLPGLDGVRRVAPAELLAHRPATACPPGGVDRRGDVAYVIFTSGSTGVPKGVEVTHENVLRLFRSTEDHFDFGEGDTWCLFHSYAFDFSVWEIFGALLYGGRLVVVPQLTSRSPEAFAELLQRERVTVLNQTPSAFRQLTAALAGRPPLEVRWVIFGGEALRFDALRPWLDSQGTGARLVNMYGITETTVHVTFFEVEPGTVDDEPASVIGRPLGDLSVVVVDAGLNRCPPGVPGELLVGGAGVSLGYRGRPDLTAVRFLRGTPYGDVVYRTGDRVVIRPDGELVYLGRIDRQVQLRGHRIELGEVESGLLGVPGVRQCVVRLDERPGIEPRLVGYLVGDVPDDAEVRRHASARLPRYMMPSVLVRLDAIPLTVNGKVAENLLPLPAPPADVGDPDAASDDDLTVAVARIWTQVVQAGPVRAHDNFFDVGGTSMHVPEVHRRLTTDLGARDLAMVELFEFTTPAALAERLRRDLPATPQPAEAAATDRPSRRAARRLPATRRHRNTDRIPEQEQERAS